MKVKNVNSSSHKTDRAIKEAFAELLKEKKSLNHITATELAKKADITRSSFYTHYDSIYDVAQELQNETLSVLMSNLEEVKTIDDFNNFIDIIFAYLKKNEKLYSMMMSSDDPLLFANKLNKRINSYISSSLGNTRESTLLKVSFYTDGCTNLIIKYFRKELNSSLDELNIFIKEIFKELFVN